METTFQNDDSRLREAAEAVRTERNALGLNELSGDLVCIIINTQPEHQQAAAAELMGNTGYDFACAFGDNTHTTAVLSHADSADILIRSRHGDNNPFRALNQFPKSEHLPDTRLETFVFSCRDLDAWVRFQRERGVVFQTPEIIDAPGYRFIQTMPSQLTGNATGMIEWKDAPGDYHTAEAVALDWHPAEQDADMLKNIGTLDHIAIRVKTEERDPAILEFMGLTCYDFDMAIHVPDLNSITNVSRLTGARFSLVFTSGIHTGGNLENSGPTEMFVRNYGARAHHMAFITKEIESVDAWLREQGQGFLSDLIGSPEEGLKQSFSAASPHTLLVNEYIFRYGDFTGFFTRHNVTELTRATEKQ